MAAPHAVNLNLKIPWQSVCTVLQLPVRNPVLPLRTTCPLCRRDTLQVYHDNNAGGAWHHCSSCNSSGDMIELAAAVWDVDTDIAIMQLASEGVTVPEDCMSPAKIASYMLRPDSRLRMNRLWASARQHYLKSASSSLATIRQKYRLKLDVGPERWNNGPGLLLGAQHKNTINSAFNSNTKITGKGWDDVLLTPFYDMPERISAFAGIGRNGDRNLDSIFQIVPCSDSRQEAGIGLLPAVAASGSPVDVIAVDDWLLALQVQMRHFRVSMRALPLVAWHDHGKRRTQCWSLLEGHNIVFWALRNLDHRVLMQAVDVDGSISTVGPAEPTAAGVADYLDRYPIQELTRSVMRAAAPWPQALRRWLKACGQPKTFELFKRLEDSGADVSRIMRNLGGRKTSPVVALKTMHTVVAGFDVVETDDTWILKSTVRNPSQAQRSGTEIMNAVLEINTVIKDRDTTELFYRGKIRYRGAVIPFIERAETVQDHTTKWLQAKLAEDNHGLLVVAPNWKQRIHNTAVAFREPRFVEDDLWKWVQKLKKEIACQSSDPPPVSPDPESPETTTPEPSVSDGNSPNPT